MPYEFRYNSADVQVIEHAALSKGSVYIDKKERKVYVGCVYAFLFGISAGNKAYNFNDAADHCFEIAKDRVSKMLIDKYGK